MNPLRTFCLVACLLAVVCASPNHHQNNKRGKNAGSNSLKPSDWLSASELEAIPSVDEVTLERLENMPTEEGAKLLQQIYHLSQINNDVSPSFVPSPSNIPAYILKSNGQNISGNMHTIVAAAKQDSNFGRQEVTVFITGLPESCQTVAKANKKLEQAYMKRYNLQEQQPQQEQRKGKSSSSSGEDSNEWTSQNTPAGDLVVIKLGNALNSYKRIAMLDTEKTGEMFAEFLEKLSNEVPEDQIHIVAQSTACPVAGSAARKFSQETGHRVRSITCLDPPKVIAKHSNSLTGLARSDADFVQAIHTSTNAMGTAKRVADVDFYVNGLNGDLETDNVIQAAMLATHVFAESVRPGNERNFPAVPATSISEYKNNNGYGKRAFMGIDTEFDVEGDYMLQVNQQSPHGKSAPASKQSSYHGSHQSWKNSRNSNKNTNKDY